MSYDAGEYNKQLKKIEQIHVELQDFKGRTKGEFLWKYFKDDYLIPVITVVVNLSSEAWDGPMSLHDMFQINDPIVLSMVENYKIHLIDPHTMSNVELEKFKTNLREVMTFIKLQKDKKTLREMMETNPRFKNIKRDAQKMIEVCTRWKFKEPENEQEEVDMCQALSEIVEDAREEGRQEMRQALSEIVEDAKESTLVENIKLIIDSFNITLEKAIEILNIPTDKYEQYQKLIRYKSPT